MSEAFMNRLVDFAESGNQQKVVLNGLSHQGWIMEINDEAMLMSTGFSDKSGKDIWISFDELKQAELFFWDNQHSQWVKFTL